MQVNTLIRVAIFLTMLGMVFGAVGAATPAFAQDNDPGVPTLVPGNDDGGSDVIVVPDTGADNDPGFFSMWTLLIILGVVVIVLLIAILARSSSPRI